MNWVLNLVLVIQIFAALAMIALVLVQHGKGADMGASFGSGASGTLFGATGGANVLSRATAFTATVFFLATLALAYFGSVRPTSTEGGTILDKPAITAPAEAPTGAGLIPGAAPVATPQSAAPAASSASQP